MDRMEALNAYLSSTGQPTFKFFGPNANCTLEICSPKWSVYSYRLSLGANVFFMCVFFCALVAHIVVGARGRAWSFMACMVCGCLDEMLGYAARVWMFYDLWNFNAFMIQVVCITTAPVFYCAGIYMVLSKTIATFAPALSRFRPSLLYSIFIPCDLVSLILQGAGGALSATSSGLSQTGVTIALAGLAFQVATLVLFCALYLEYLTRFYRTGLASQRRRQLLAHAPSLSSSSLNEQRGEGRGSRGVKAFGARLRVFYAFEALAVVMILARCAFRVVELRDGYGGPLVRREGLFIGLEGVLIVVAAFALCVGHPGLLFNATPRSKSSAGASSVEKGHLDKQAACRG